MIAAHRRQSPPIARAAVAPKVGGDRLGVEAKPRPATRPEPVGAQLFGMVIDPTPAHPPPLRNLLGRDQPLSRLLRLGARQQLGEAARNCLDRLGAETKIVALLDRVAHRRLPKGVRLTFGLPGHPRAWWAMRAAAISM